ncbi:MAG: hypothetical protein RL701_5632 [Pseudomonadota bacterium]
MTERVPSLSAALEHWRSGVPVHAVRKQQWSGTHRSRTLTSSLEHVRSVAALAGVTRVANVTGLDTVGLPVVAVYRPNARSLVVSQGKGLDLVAATVSGLMEAVESHHAEHPDLPLRLASQRELNTRGRVIAVDKLAHVAGQPFLDHRSTLWTQGVELNTGEALWAPFEIVHTNFTVPLPAGSGCFMMSSNGLASGNHPLEATSHGLCEVVERDAVALFHAAGGFSQSRNRIQLSSIDALSCREVLARFEAADLACGVWDITTDVGLAAFLCVIVDRSANMFRPLYYANGSGCHPAREVALLRALTEAAQCRLTYIAGARDDADREFFERARNPDRIASMRQCIDAGATGGRAFPATPNYDATTLDDDVTWELNCLERVGLREVGVFDLSKPEFGIAVVRVVVPGLEALSGAPGYTAGPRALRERAQASS